MAEVLVLAERTEDGPSGATGPVRKATLELLTLARRLGDPVALVCGTADDATVETLGEYGATTVYVAEPAGVGDLLVGPKVDALVATILRCAPLAVLVTAGREGTEIAGRAAVRLDSGIITNAVEVAPGAGGPLVTQSVFAGGFTADSEVVRGTPIVTVRPNAVTPAAVDATPSAPPVVPVDVSAGAGAHGRVVSRTPKTSTGRPALTDASVVVAGGRGMGSAAAFGTLEELADAMGAAVAASRAATDLGWYDHDFQIGQTGKTVAPQLYLAAGISGAIQHRAGMQGSRTVVAINKDPKAPIFDISDFGVVGDANAVLPALAEEIRRRKT